MKRLIVTHVFAILVAIFSPPFGSVLLGTASAMLSRFNIRTFGAFKKFSSVSSFPSSSGRHHRKKPVSPLRDGNNEHRAEEFIVENDLSQMTGDLGKLSEVSMDREHYLFGDCKTFVELGVHEALSLSLENINKHTATAIQAASFETILSERDTVIAAETGSGKTLAYLLPIFQKLLELEDEEGVEDGEVKPTSLWKTLPYNR